MTSYKEDSMTQTQQSQVATMAPRSKAEAEERSLALLQYFQPDDLEQLSLGNERSALNEALSPHLQLLGHQCAVDRIFISVFDRDLMYIIAETGLGTDTEALAGSDCKGFPLPGRLCTYTLDQPCPPLDETVQPFFQIPDLSKDDRFKTYPFVCDPEGPQYRFYAGIRMVTPRGTSIGTVAMMGKEARQSLTATQERDLREMAARIMDYFNIRKEAAEGRRLRMLVNNLSQFVVDVPSQSISLSSRSTAFSSSPGKTTKIKKSGYRVTDNAEIFHRAVTSIENALQLQEDGGVLFLKSKPSPSLPTSSVDDNDRIISCSKCCSRSLSSCSGFDIARLTKTALGGLLDQYPRGKMWQYDAHGILPSIDTDSEREEQAWTPDTDGSQDDFSWDSLVRSIHPQARQILMVPLLDAGTSDWNSACFVWSASASRLFSKAELGTLLTYGQAIMAECSLQDAMKSGLQKADFIGSISHELRTPLHGILAGLEFVKEENHLSEFQTSVINMIETSGEALLDTVNHILDFSKINTFEESKRKRVLNGHGHKKSKSLLNQLKFADFGSGDFQTLAEVCNVALLAEQAADMIYMGKLKAQADEVAHLVDTSPTKSLLKSALTQQAGNIQQEPTRPASIELVLDITNEDYHYHVQKGALKRVMINIIGNAMKYTNEGIVTIKLYKEKSLVPVGSLENVIFECTDTGCGMSDVFVRSRLFTPFTQEDPIKPGTGLGLSICKSIVESLGGQIQVESAVGKGTTFKITLPLSRTGTPPASAKSSFLGSPIVPVTRPGFVSAHTSCGFENRCRTSSDVAPTGQHSHDRVCQYLKEWFDMKEGSFIEDSRIKILVLDDSAMNRLTAEELQHIRQRSIGFLLICDSLARQVQLEKQCRELNVYHSAFICKPCGPYKLISHVESLLERIACDQKNGIKEEDNKAPTIIKAPAIIKATEGLQSLSIENKSLNAQTIPVKPATTPETNGTTTTAVERTLPTASHPIPTNPSTSTPARQPRILLVDDNNINLRLLASFCSRRKYLDVQLAADGQIALNIVRSRPAAQAFDIIFMDISMPVMNGFQATAAIRQYERELPRKPARIIALTGLANERDREEGIKVGMDLYLTKPFRFGELDQILDQWIRQEGIAA